MLERWVKDCIKLKENVAISSWMPGSSREELEAQKVLNSILKICYPFISQGHGYSDFSANLASFDAVNVTLDPIYIPEGSEDKVTIKVGKFGYKQSAMMSVWKEDGHDVKVECMNCREYSSKLSCVSCTPTLKMLKIVTVKSNKLVISSTDGASKKRGVFLGQYEYGGFHNGADYYVQSQDQEAYVHNNLLLATNPIYLYRGDDRAWRAGINLGSSDASKYGLYHPPTEDSDTPPRDGWQYRDDREYPDDPSLLITPGPLSPLKSITVQAPGDVVYPDCLGTFTLTEQWRRGRPVYRNEKGKHLFYSGIWSIEGLIWSQQSWLCPTQCDKWQYKSASNWEDANLQLNRP